VQSHIKLVLACIFMVILGVVMGMLVEGWEFLTSLYVIVQIVTTIGYGDVTVENEWMQLFMAFYVLACLLVVANFLNLIFDLIVESNIQFMRERLRKAEIVSLSSVHDEEEAKVSWGTFNQLSAALVMLILAILSGTLFFKFSEDCTCSYGASRETFGLQECDNTSFESCVSTGGLRMTWSSSFYMSVITVTTVGFGDFSPKSRLGRGIGILWMLFGVTVTAYFIKALSDVLSWEERKMEFEGAKHINQQIFQAMDKDGNGHLSKDEYALYVLVKHELVSKDILQDIFDKYDSMDLSGEGRLTYEMLRASKQEDARRQEVPAHDKQRVWFLSSGSHLPEEADSATAAPCGVDPVHRSPSVLSGRTVDRSPSVLSV